MQVKNNKNTMKLILLVSIIIIFFLYFLYMYFSPRNYEIKYKVNKVNILESYNKEYSYYYFKLSYKNKNFEFVSEEDYINKRRLIEKLKIKKTEDVICLIPESNKITLYPICYKDNKQIDYNLTGIDFSEYKKNVNQINKNYKDIKINTFNDKTYLIWDYNGFIFLNNNESKKIKLLNKDVYNLELVAFVNNYLIIPDYENDHSFKKMYIINIDKGTLKEWELKYEIYYDSYILGTHDKSIYLFDKKNEIEYELRPDKQKMRKINFRTLVDGKWESTTLAKLKNQIKFREKNVSNYEVINNKLYLTFINKEKKELVSKQKVSDIIYTYDNVVYYLVGEDLYMYSKETGEVLLMSYFEWNFNYQNMIYIY